jgi:hypothetical protein
MGVARYRTTGELRGATERREGCRYPSVRPEALLGWWNDGTFGHVTVCIVNVSTVGCLVETNQAVARERNHPVWLCPLGLEPGQWKEGTVVAIKRPFLGKYAIRIKFASPFAYESFRTLICNAEHGAADPDRSVPEHETDQFWR